MIYLDGIGTASIVKGVARIETIYRDSQNANVRGEDLVIPMHRLNDVIHSLQVIAANAAQNAPSAQPVDDERSADQKLWAFALQIHRKYGDKSAAVVSNRIQQLATAGDVTNLQTWKAIQARLTQLLQDEAAPLQ